MVFGICVCREYNEFASSVQEESNKMRAVQKEAVAKQVKLDEESLQRLKEAEAKDKVSSYCPPPLLPPYPQDLLYAMRCCLCLLLLVLNAGLQASLVIHFLLTND